MPVTTLFPPLADDRLTVALPVTTVTVFEDRAQVQRSATLPLAAGLQRLRIADVAPVLQDVSLHAAAPTSVRVCDVRVRRALRVTRAQRPEAVREQDDAIDALVRQHAAAAADRERAQARIATIEEILARAAGEIPEDAAWGRVDPEAWRGTFEGLMERRRAQHAQILARAHSQQDTRRELARAISRRRATARVDDRLAAWIDLDLLVEAAGTHQITVTYTTPGALWRPIHRAQLSGGELRFTSAAAVWQRTGEDWTDVTLRCSTARSSLGTEPPILGDDLLTAQRRQESVQLQTREVAVDRVGPGGGAPPSAVALPGVDDGGEVQELTAEGAVTIPADGRPCMLPLFRFSGPARTEQLTCPEIDARVMLRSVQGNGATTPIMPGPVELLTGSGAVGWSEVRFVAPGAPFELGFGPVADVRVSRTEEKGKTRTHHVDKWRRTNTIVKVFLSNLGDESKTVTVKERIPVSELEEVQVSVLDDETTDAPGPDSDGFCEWTVTLPAGERRVITLGWRLAVAPGITLPDEP